MAWSAQARGFFSGRFSPSMRDDIDGINDSYTRRVLEVYGTDENFEKLRRAKELGDRKGGYSATEIALAWLLHKPFPIVPIVGPLTREELSSCIHALSLELTDSELSWLDSTS
jgi:aryl-alcohol dehydrogenase-like predicted oxidoreductase